MAMYQPAISKQEDSPFSSGVMEESEVCSLPGGLASVRKQFETQETATSHNVTQFHFHHRTVQEMSNSDVTVISGATQVIPGSQQLHFNQQEMVTFSDSNLASSYENHNNETDEEFPRYTTKELRDHFEKTIEEAAPSKQIKIAQDINRSKWSSNVTQKATSETYEASAIETYEASAIESSEDTSAEVMDYEDFPPPPPEDSEYLPPPPPDLLQMPSDSPDIPECYYSPEPPEPVYSSKQQVNKEAYFKQRNMYELKRLYKHIHPEVRKNIEREYYSDGAEMENNQHESQEYVYEDDGSSPNNISMSPDQEYLEWDEILHGEVQSMRWMFENKPLDTIKDETPDEDDDNKKITQQEIIVGKDVRRTAWMFETKPMDELSSHNIDSTEYRNKFNKLDKGDVRAAAWLFETQPMASLNKMHREEDLTKELLFTEEDGNATIYMIDNKYMETLGHTETIDESHLLSLRSVLEEIQGETKTITSTFDTQFMCILMGQASQMLEIKSVRKIETELESSIASRWLFDTQPLDLTNRDSTPLKLVCSLSMEDNNKGDWGRWLFEIKTLNSLEEWEGSSMQKEEIIGADVRKHCLVFETQPMDTLKDDSNARSQSIEYVIGGNVRSARNFFESSPQVARKNLNEVGKLKKAQMNEEERGDVRHQKWRFESQPLEHIREERKEFTRTVNVEEDLTQEDGTSCRADVRKNCWVFETQPMDTLKDDSNARTLSKEDVIAGNVRSARHYFETMPAEELKELAEVGKLKKTVTLEEERGDVRHQKWQFESQALENIREEKKEIIRTIDLEEIDKVDVSNYKQIFETTDLSRRDESQKILIEGVTSGAVKSNKNLFESNQLYAMQDSSGHFHEVKTVRREEVVKGDVTTCKWMFETRPIDQFGESISNYQIIKGISKQEIESGDVKTAKWLFETQPLDAIKYFSNIEDEEIVETNKNVDIMKGDVKTCKWLFETKPMDILYEKVEMKSENEEMHKGDVKTCTWLFETQALDTIRDETETVLKTCTVNQEEVMGKDVRMARFLFETENLENLTGEERSGFARVTEIDIESGDVSRMKYIFENQTSDIMTSTSEEIMQKLKTVQSEDIHKGNVVNCKWLFENQSIDTIKDSQEESTGSLTVNDVQGGNVDKGRFIFETYSLDKIQEVSSETETDITKMQKIVREEDERGDVRNYTMMFETQPLYAIQDKEGNYHEVTTVTSEEVMRGDVVGSRWLFETKPLDSIKDTDEVYVIKSVTQEDVQRGDVTSAKWKFETQPLDRIAEENKVLKKTVDDIQGGDVRTNMHRFESDALSLQSVRTVDVSEIQKGDVRTAKWRFETQSIDKIRSMSSENLIETVKKEEVAMGDVKQSVWLFEKNPLDHIKEMDENEHATVTREEIPKADVKTTTWLFETTPFHDFNETSMEKTEILGKSIKGTLEELYSKKMVSSKGVLIEADEIGDVRMAKYQLMNKDAPEIQREEIIRGDLQSIMMNLLNRRETKEKQIVIDSEEMGHISSTVHQLFNQERDVSVEKEEILRGDIQEAVNNLLKEDRSAKRGILIQEDEMGDVRMTIYSLLNQQDGISLEKEDVVRGDIRSALQNLSRLDNPDQMTKIRVDDREKGNVQFYSTCIESGALDYLKQLHVEPNDETFGRVEKEEIIGGDIKGTKLILGRNQTQFERTVEDIVPGDVHNTVKVFMSEPTMSLEGLQKEEIVRGDLKAALNSLSESTNQTIVVEKEEVVKGNIPKTLRCLERAQRQYKEVEKPDIIRGNIKGALRSLEKSATSKVEVVVEDLVAGDVKATLRSLDQAKQAVRDVEKEEIVRGDIHTTMQCLQYASSEKRTCQQDIDVQGDVRGTIQLFLEPPSSPRMQRRASFEGDVKMSIKSLYETQEQNQLEKEEVIKGDVKGTIKSLLETAHREPSKVRLGAYRRVRVKQAPPVKNLNVDAQRNIQKIKTAKVVTAETSTQETQSHATQQSTQSHATQQSTQSHATQQSTQSHATQQSTQSHVTQQSTQKSTTVVEHRTITQNHGVKTLKTEFRNLNSNPKGMIRLDKTQVKRDIHIPKPKTPESDLPLPPPPPPMVDSDLPPPPTPPPPPPSDELDHLPPPPPPVTGEHDFLPPPPSQQELDNMPSQTLHPSPGKATKMTVKKVKAPAMHPVPKLEAKVQMNKTQQVVSETSTTTSRKSVVEMSKSESQSTSHSSKTVSSEIPLPPESPRPLKKVYVNPIRFTPPPSPPPFMKGKMSRFTTPLIKAEEKFRKLKEDNTPPTTPPPTYIHDSVTAALEMLSNEGACTEQSKKNITSGFTEERDERTVTKIQSGSLSFDLSKDDIISDTPQRNALISTENELNPPDSTIISAAEQHIVSNQTSKVAAIQQTSSISTVRQQTVTASTQKIVSVSSTQSVQTATAETKKEFKNMKIKGSNKSEDIMKNEKSTLPEKVPETFTPEERVKSSKSQQSEDKKKKDNTASKVSDNVQDQPSKTENLPTEKSVRAAKSVQPDNKKKNDNSVTQGQEKASDQPVKAEKATSDVNGKNGKTNQKAKKNNKQEKQIEIKEPKQVNESEKKNISQAKDVKVEVKEIAAVKVSTEHKEVKTEVKEIQKASTAAATTTTTTTATTRTVAASDNQPATPTPARKKKKNKKSRNGGQSGQGKDTATPTPVSETTTVVQKDMKQEHVQVHKEVIITENKVQSFQQQETFNVQNQVKASQKKKAAVTNQQNTDKLKEESRDVPIKVTGKSAPNELVKSTTERKKDSQRREVEALISHITELQGASGKTDSKSVKTLLNTIPEWLMSTEEKSNLEGSAVENNVEKLQEIVLYVRKLAQAKLMSLEGNYTVEKHECEPISEKIVSGGATPKISKISIGSAKVETQTKKKTSHESKKQEVTQVKRTDPRAPSPSLRMRPPSPTFITIESTRRTDSPQRVTPSPTPLHRPATPPTPPPRRSDTPTSRITRITPSPTFDKAENLSRLKGTMAKLSRGVTPPPSLTRGVTPPPPLTRGVTPPPPLTRGVTPPPPLTRGVTPPPSLIREVTPPPSLTRRVTPPPSLTRGVTPPPPLTRGVTPPPPLPRGVTPPPVCLPQQVPGKKSEIVESPESFQRQIKIEPHTVETSAMSDVTVSVREKKELFEVSQKGESNPPHARKDPIDIPERLGADANEQGRVSETTTELIKSFQQNDQDAVETSDMSDLSIPSTSVRDKTEFFEEAEKAKKNKTYVRKDPIDIPERLGPDMEESDTEHQGEEKEELPKVDWSGMLNKFESPEEKVYARKEPIPLAERLENESDAKETDKQKADILEEEMPCFDIHAIKHVFELGEQSSSFKEEKNYQEELVSNLSETTTDSSKWESSQGIKASSRQSTPLPAQKDVVEAVPAEPSGCSETKSFTEHFSNVDEFGNKTVGKRNTTTVSQHSESVSTQPVTFSYADAVKRKAEAAARRTETYDEASTEELLRNFHKTWTESETVFKSLGYSVSEEMSHVSHQTKTVIRVPKSELCTVCQRRVYPMDALIVDRKKYHKTCFCCEHCKSQLSLGNYISLHGHLYCPHHYKQLLKSKGNYENELGLKPPTRNSGPILSSQDQLEWRYSMNSIGSNDKDKTFEKVSIRSVDKTKLNTNKISVVWPPQSDPPKKAFKVEEDIQLTKPQWPPPDTSPKSPKHPHRKAVPRSVL